jgi:hypothetical protein
MVQNFYGTLIAKITDMCIEKTSSGQVFGTYLNRSNNNTWTYPMISNTALTVSQINDSRFNPTNAAVTIPPAVFLFSGGLFGLMALRKKIKA